MGRTRPLQWPFNGALMALHSRYLGYIRGVRGGLGISVDRVITDRTEYRANAYPDAYITLLNAATYCSGCKDQPFETARLQQPKNTTDSRALVGTKHH